MVDWRKLTPIYEPSLSVAGLLAAGKLFSIGHPNMSKINLAPHWHDCYELGYVSQGSGIIVMGDHVYPIQAGQVYIINDLEPHMGYSEDPDAMLFVMHFHPHLLDKGWVKQLAHHAQMPFLPSSGFQGPLIPLDDPVTVPTRQLLMRIQQEAVQTDVGWELVVGGLLLQIVGVLSRRLAHVGEMAPEVDRENSLRRQALHRINPILQMIEQNYAEPLSLDMMAEAGHLSRSHCCALFRVALDTTPIAYRNLRRLAEARHLLQNTALTVVDVAYQVGFSSVQEFNRLYKREFGTTPSDTRRQL